MSVCRLSVMTRAAVCVSAASACVPPISARRARDVTAGGSALLLWERVQTLQRSRFPAAVSMTDPSKHDITAVLKRLRSVPTNKVRVSSTHRAPRCSRPSGEAGRGLTRHMFISNIWQLTHTDPSSSLLLNQLYS